MVVAAEDGARVITARMTEGEAVAHSTAATLTEALPTNRLAGAGAVGLGEQVAGVKVVEGVIAEVGSRTYAL